MVDTRRAKLIIDGGHLLKSQTGRAPFDMPFFLSKMERTFNVRFTRKILFQGTFNGAHNSFHTLISHPSGGHVTCRISPMKLIHGNMYHPQERRMIEPPQQASLCVEKGVDVKIALELQKEPLPHEEMYDILIIISGDGDLDEAVREANKKRRVIVCPKIGTCAAEMNEFIFIQDNGQPVYLDTLLYDEDDVCFTPPRGLTMARKWSSPVQPPPPPALAPPRRQTCRKRCPLIQPGPYFSAEHAHLFIHPCHFGGKCRHVLDRGASSSSNPQEMETYSEEDMKKHMFLFSHPCKNYFDCTNEDPSHCLMFLHVPKSKKSEEN
jgi:hypothetical protein